MHIPTSLRDVLTDLVRGWIDDELDGPVRTEPALLARASLPHHGVFVTLHTGSMLRGCVGCLDCSIPLARALEQATRNACSHDYRFPQLAVHERDHLHGTISILEAMECITPEDEIQIGIDGLCVELGFRRGLLLPQVAAERKWNHRQFLAAVLEKAALPPAALNDPACVLRKFTCEIIDFDCVPAGS